MSEIITNKLTGKTAAKTVTVTVGASATQSIEQGLAKAWIQYLQATPVVSDSFNVSSVDDNSTGDFDVNYTNAFATSAHARAVMSNDSRICGVQNRFTTSTEFANRSDSGSLDDTGAYGSFHGDLA